MVSTTSPSPAAAAATLSADAAKTATATPSPAAAPKPSVAVPVDPLKSAAVPDGVILPPPEIRATADKTALAVAKHGPTFEARIRDDQAKAVRFCFLKPGDAYRPYYEWKLRLAAAALGSAAAGAPAVDAVGAAATDAVSTAAAQASPGIATPVLGAPIKNAAARDVLAIEGPPPEAPPPFLFYHEHPPITRLDWEVLLLTARHAALSGRGFLASLAQRERDNAQFAFLRPGHTLYGLFDQLTRQYERILTPSPALLETLRADAANPLAMLPRIEQRARYERWDRRRRALRERAHDAQRRAAAGFDWAHFTIVQTVPITRADLETALPRPMLLSELQARSLRERQRAREEAAQNAAQQQAALQAAAAGGAATPASPAAATPTSAQTATAGGAASSPATTAPQPAAKTKAGRKIKIRDDYTPNLGTAPSTRGAASAGAAEPTQLCPQCGLDIPVSEYNEHIRIELLDPRGRAQRQAADAKLRESNLLQGEGVAAHLARLATQRALGSGDSSQAPAGGAAVRSGKSGSAADAAADGTATGAASSSGPSDKTDLPASANVKVIWDGDVKSRQLVRDVMARHGPTAVEARAIKRMEEQRLERLRMGPRLPDNEARGRRHGGSRHDDRHGSHRDAAAPHSAPAAATAAAATVAATTAAAASPHATAALAYQGYPRATAYGAHPAAAGYPGYPPAPTYGQPAYGAAGAYAGYLPGMGFPYGVVGAVPGYPGMPMGGVPPPPPPPPTLPPGTLPLAPTHPLEGADASAAKRHKGMATPPPGSLESASASASASMAGMALPPLPTHPGPTFTLTIKRDDQPDLQLTGIHAGMLLSQVKEQCAQLTGIASSRQKLVVPSSGVVVKNAETVSTYGLQDGSALTLAVKERGNRKKC